MNVFLLLMGTGAPPVIPIFSFSTKGKQSFSIASYSGIVSALSTTTIGSSVVFKNALMALDFPSLLFWVIRVIKGFASDNLCTILFVLSVLPEETTTILVIWILSVFCVRSASKSCLIEDDTIAFSATNRKMIPLVAGKT